MNRFVRALVAGTLFCVVIALPSAGFSQSSDSNRPQTAIPFKQDDASTSTSLGIALAFVAGLAVAAIAAVYFARKFAIAPGLIATGSRRMRLIETLRLGPRTTLFLVQIDQRIVLMAQTGDSLTVVPQANTASTGASSVNE